MKTKLVLATIIGITAMGLTFSMVFAQTKGDAKKGKAIVNKSCAACHGKDGNGKAGMGPSIYNRDFTALASDDFIRNTIKKGRAGTGMIPFASMKDEDVNNIIAYLRSYPVYVPVKLKVDASLKFSGNSGNGRKLFASYCSHCHGAKGEGYSAGGAGTAIGKKGFLNIASDDYIFKTLQLGRVGTAMKKFVGPLGLANISEQDAKDIIVFLRENAH